MFRRSLSLLSNVAAKNTYVPTSPLFAEIAKNKPSYDEIVAARNKYLAPSLRTFQAYDKPLVLASSFMQYMWDSEVKEIALISAKTQSLLLRVVAMSICWARIFASLLGIAIRKSRQLPSIR
jgi:hypothetical protein